MQDLAFNTSTSDLLKSLDLLPAAPSPEVSDKYMFIDSRKVVEDMRDLGFEVAGFRRPKHRTRAGAFGSHEIDFRRPQDVDKNSGETGRVIFLNSYDGSRRATFLSGVFRFVCSNGLVVGNTFQSQKFLHLGDYEEQLLAEIKASGQTAMKVFDRIEVFKSTKISEKQVLALAAEASKLRFGEEGLSPEPNVIAMPRRREDLRDDLWTQWNVIQENLLKGGVPGRDISGNIRMTRPLAQIQKSNTLNAALWDLMEGFAKAA